MRKLIKLLWLLIIPLLLAGCKPNKENHKNVPPGYEVLTIQAQPFQKKLYFASRIMPLTCEPLTSMADGIVMAKNFQYGKKVTKGDLLFTIRSTKEQLDYQAALTRYFQAKQYFSQSMNDYQSNATLWQKGIVSQDTYVRSQRDYLSNRLALLQAEANLRKFLKTEQEFSSLEKLSMENTAEVDRVLQLDKLAREINIYAPQTGLAVFKAKGSDADKTINVGDEVKKWTNVIMYCG